MVVAVFGGFFGNPTIQKSAVLQGVLRFQEKVMDVVCRTHKAGALPAALHPNLFDTQFISISDCIIIMPISHFVNLIL